MALSNMVQEPRRELTETALGVLIAAPFVLADYWFATWFVASIPDMANTVNTMGRIFFLALGMIVGGLGIGLGFIVLVVIHEIGSDFCDALQNRGVHLRPRVRPNGRR